MAQSGIITGQYVRIRQATASVGDRIFAQMIDWVILLAYMIFSVWVLSEIKADEVWTFFIVIIPMLFYTLCMEIFHHGQSLGKMAMKMRVVKQDGSTPTLGAYVMRWLLYIVDGPGMSFLGLLIMILTKDHQRLGDLAAGTVVIKLQNYRKIQVNLDEYDYLMKDYTPRYPQAADLSLEQIEIITRSVNTPRRDFLPRIAQLSVKVQQKLNISRQESTDVEFLRRILRDYQYYALEEI
jgi:uncharacterized RDD family membrane protein YckC